MHPVTKETYSLDGETVTLGQGHPMQVTVDGSQMTLAAGLLARPSAPFSAGFDKATGTGTQWRGVAVSP